LLLVRYFFQIGIKDIMAWSAKPTRNHSTTEIKAKKEREVQKRVKAPDRTKSFLPSHFRMNSFLRHFAPLCTCDCDCEGKSFPETSVLCRIGNMHVPAFHMNR